MDWRDEFLHQPGMALLRTERREGEKVYDLTRFEAEGLRSTFWIFAWRHVDGIEGLILNEDGPYLTEAEVLAWWRQPHPGSLDGLAMPAKLDDEEEG